jgi:hypothetical protein
MLGHPKHAALSPGLCRLSALCLMIYLDLSQALGEAIAGKRALTSLRGSGCPLGFDIGIVATEVP